MIRLRPLAPALAALCAALCAAPCAAVAQEALRLRASEFSSFSRVALDLPPEAAFEAGRDGRALVLTLPGTEGAVDARAIFPERRVSRVLRVASEPAQGGVRLTFSMACACEADVYRLGPRTLVLDFRDPETAEPEDAAPETTPPAERSQTARAARPAPEQAAAPTPQDAPAASDERAAAAADAARDVVSEAEPVAAPGSARDVADGGDHDGSPQAHDADHAMDHGDDHGAEDHAAAGADDHADPAAGPDIAPDAPDAADEGPAPGSPEDVAAVVAEAQRRLLAQLSRAAEEGLVDFAQPEPDPMPDPQEEHADAGQDGHGDAHDDAAKDDPLAALVDSGQVEIRNVLDRDRREATPKLPARCLSDRRFRLPVREAAEDPAVVIGKARVELVNALDQVDRPAVGRLARAYIAMGFGAEAVAAMKSAEPPLNAAPLLADMASIVDGGGWAEGGPIADQKDCPGLAMAWRMAAANADGAEIEDDAAAAQRLADALAGVAPPLRHLLGAQILERLLAAGRMEPARRVVAVMERAPGPRTPERRLAMAKFDIAEGREAKGERALRALAGGAAPASAEATALLIERLLASGREVSRTLTDSAAAAAVAHRGEPLGARLKAAEIRARGGDRFLEALDVLETEIERGDVGDQTLKDVARELFLAAGPERDGAVVYAGAAIARQDLLGDDPGADAARAATAEKLTGLGLANAALDMVAPGVGRFAPADLAAARAHAALGEGDAALKLLAGREDADAAAVKLAAMQSAGRHSEAWDAAQAAPALDPADRAAFAWRAGDWRAAASLAPEAPRATFAAWASGAEPAEAAELRPDLAAETLSVMGAPPPYEKPSLKDARALIARSRAAETLIEEALRDG